jgi:hypothetical protein
MAGNCDSHGLTGKQLLDVVDVSQGSIPIVKANISRAEDVVDRCNPRALVFQRRGLADLQLTGRTFRAANQVKCPENHVDVRRSKLDESSWCAQVPRHRRLCTVISSITFDRTVFLWTISRDTRKVLLFLYPLELITIERASHRPVFSISSLLQAYNGCRNRIDWADIKRHRAPLDLWIVIDGKGKREGKKKVALLNGV